MGEAVLRTACPGTGDVVVIAVDAAWLVRSPGTLHISWHCPCEATHHLARLVTRQAESAIRSGGVRLVDVGADRELVDPQRAVIRPPLAADEVSALIDELWLDTGTDVVSVLPLGLIAAVVHDIRAGRRIAAELTRAGRALANIRRRPG